MYWFPAPFPLKRVGLVASNETMALIGCEITMKAVFGKTSACFDCFSGKEGTNLYPEKHRAFFRVALMHELKTCNSHCNHKLFSLKVWLQEIQSSMSPDRERILRLREQAPKQKSFTKKQTRLGLCF